MNGLHTASPSLGASLRSLSQCPAGTPGRILSRRLSSTAHRSSSSSSDGDGAAATNPPPQKPSNFFARNHEPGPLLTGEGLPGRAEWHFAKYHAPSPPLVQSLNPRLTGLTPLYRNMKRSPLVYRLLSALDANDKDAAWAVFCEIRDRGLTHELSGADYSILLRSLRPADYVSPYDRGALDESYGAFLLPPADAWHKLKERLGMVVQAMRGAGHRLVKQDYLHLLDCGRAAEDHTYLDRVWNTLAGSKTTRADTYCYNTYMAGMCGNPSTQREFRLDVRAVEKRSAPKRGDPRSLAWSIYNKMNKRGIAPNAMTIEILVLAMARMGDIASVNYILGKIWGVSETTDAGSTLAPSAPLYPSAHTLLAVAIAYGSVGKLVSAARLVDVLSSRYRLAIPTSVWIALLNWTYVWASPVIRHGEGTRPVLAPEPVTADAVERIWHVMANAPYFCPPTFEMYDYPVRSLLWRSMPDAAEKAMADALPLLAQIEETARGAAARADALELAMQQEREATAAAAAAATTTASSVAHGEVPDEDAAAREVLLKARAMAAHYQRQVHRSRSMLRRWIELLVLGRRMEGDLHFERIRRPQIVERWDRYLGEKLHFATSGGYFTMQLGEPGSDWRLSSAIRRRKTEPMPLGTGAKEEDDLF